MSSENSFCFNEPCGSSNEISHVITISQAKAALSEAIAAMNHPHNMMQMQQARNNCSSGYQYGQHAQMDMVRHMQFVFPIATEILMDVISNYGFSRSGEGVIQFTMTVKDMEKVDPDVARLNGELRNYFLPKMQSPIHNAPTSSTSNNH